MSGKGVETVSHSFEDVACGQLEILDDLETLSEDLAGEWRGTISITGMC